MAHGDAEPLCTLLLVRHGHSRAMADKVVGGPKGCKGLTDLGRRQAEALRDRFASGSEPEVDVVYSSPLPRARETTDIVVPALGKGSALEVHVHDDLEEMRLPPVDGLTWDEAREQFEWEPPDGDPFKPVIEGAESRAGFRHRTAVALAEIARRHPGSTVFVGCHGGVVGAAVATALGIGPWQHGVEHTPALTSITQVEVLHDEGGLRWLCRRYNDGAHLAPLAAA